LYVPVATGRQFVPVLSVLNAVVKRHELYLMRPHRAEPALRGEMAAESVRVGGGRPSAAAALVRGDARRPLAGACMRRPGPRAPASRADRLVARPHTHSHRWRRLC